MRSLTQRDARRVAVTAQLLSDPRPTDALEVFRTLTLVQMDLTAAVAPNADLVLFSRLGQDYRPELLDDLLEERAVVEVDGMLRPAEDVALYRAEFAAWPGPEPLTEWQRQLEGWVEANHACRDDILTRLRSEGPLPARELPDTCALPWRSSGWTNHKNVQRLLDLMAARGEVAVSSRENRERVWDLAERVYPDTEVVPYEEARAERNRRRLRSLGIARAKAAVTAVEPNDVGETGVEVVIDGVRGRWRMDPTLAATLEDDPSGGPFAPRTVLLSPLDRLVFDRKRMADLFGFDYQLEMYKPAAQRRWGYFALPVLHGAELVGKLDARTDLERGVLRVDAMHWDIEPDPALRRSALHEVGALARMIGVEAQLAAGVALG
jgi:uncharacterized protein YcaQ